MPRGDTPGMADAVHPRIGAPFWTLTTPEALSATDSMSGGLSVDEAGLRLARDGPGSTAPRTSGGRVRLLVGQFANPIILILISATVLSMVIGDPMDGAVILVIIVASGAIGFWQEDRADHALELLTRQVHIDVEVMRAGLEMSIPLDEVVMGDVVVLRAGDLVPADCLVLECTNLLLDETVLTGESYPAEKSAAEAERVTPPSADSRDSAVFAGTHVVSGWGSVLVMRTGSQTTFGALSAELGAADVTTSFERGMTTFGRMLVWAIGILVAGVLGVNLVLNRPFVESVLFSLALAVGITPQLLPAIVAVSLSAGARRLASQQVLVKRLDALEDFGSMTVLCSDKTGTLTQGNVELDAAYDLRGHPSAEVLRLAVLNATLQQGFANPIDQALARRSVGNDREAIAEIPYDFQRKRISVLLKDATEHLLITKGAFAEVVSVCTQAQVRGTDIPVQSALPFINRQFADLADRGFRVLAVATRRMESKAELSRDDESGMTLVGLLAFHDPVKDSASQAVSDLAQLGVRTILITGDNRLSAVSVADRVGLRHAGVLTGSEVESLSDDAIRARLVECDVCAEIEPLQKERLVRILRQSGESVGLLGDGINDTAALHAADVGISVDSAVDVARQAAAIVLLDKDLRVVVDGIRIGRATFANTLKYVRVTISANFGNVLSMAVASAFLPFLPLLPLQILLLNFLSDVPALTISEDSVDEEDVKDPRSWNIRAITGFMVTFGLVSSVFDISTFLLLRLAFDADVEVFRSAWFIESTATELAAMLVLRTARHFWRSRPGSALLWSSIAVAVVTVVLPYTPLAPALGLTEVPVAVLASLVGVIAGYVAATEVAKRYSAAFRAGHAPHRAQVHR